METLVASIVLFAGLLAVASLVDASNGATSTTRARVIATNAAREIVEAARGIPYDNVTDSKILAEIQASDSALADAQPGLPYTIERRGVVFTITADTCILDDGRDGGGDAPRAGDYCADSVPAGTRDPRNNRTDRFPEDYKRVRVDVKWSFEGRERAITQTTFINNPGSAGAPAIASLSSSTLGNPPRQVGPGETSINFSATTTSVPSHVSWLLDGSAQGLVCTGCSGRGPFTFTWTLDPGGKVTEDGHYLIAAEAYDRYNVAGASRSLTVIVNRSQPIAPRDFAGGRQPDGKVEFEWLPNPERDLVGYSVYRYTNGGGEALVCSLTLATRCTDNAPLALDPIEYRIRAWDVDSSGNPRLNASATGFSSISVSTANRPPNAAVNVRRTNNAGSVKLTWSRPSPSDPDTGDSIVYYRVYRDGLAVSNRYARADDDGTNASFEDYAGTAANRYWVVAVDTNLRESAAVEATP